MGRKVYVTRALPRAVMEELGKAGEVTANEAPRPATKEELLSGVKGMDAIVTMLNDKIDATLESSDDFSQQKIVSEMSDIHLAWRTDGGDWQTKTIGSMEGAACVMPAVAVS